MQILENKYNDLLSILKKYERIAVAFSGGVDSTLLLYAAQTALGCKNVTGLYSLSNLNSEKSVQNTRQVFVENFPEELELKEIEFFPLMWKEFILNTEERCYFCKKRMYLTFQATMASDDFFILADGTNVNDLKERRPGLRALRELNVITPLVDAGLTKSEIRTLASKFSLSNHDLPSNSCLATRVAPGCVIDEKILNIIDSAERFLHDLGFSGCRVRPKDELTIVEVQNGQLNLFMKRNNRVQVQHYFQSLGLNNVVLSLKGR